MLSSATKIAAGVTKKLAENDIRHGADKAVHALETDGHDVLDAAGDYANAATQKVRTLYDQTVDTTHRVTSNIESEFRSNPVRAGIVTLGLGFILGALLTRR